MSSSSWLLPPVSPRVRAAEHMLTIAAGAYVAGIALHTLAVHGPSGLLRAVVGSALSVARAVPGVSRALDGALDGALKELEDSIAPFRGELALHVLPAAARAADDVAAEIERGIAADAERAGLSDGVAFGGIYHPMGVGGRELHALQARVAAACLDTNLLYPGIFATGRRVEAEAVAMAGAMVKCIGLGGGLFTSGGTESVLLAVKAHRDGALAALGYVGVADNGRGLLTPAVARAARDGIVLKIVCGTTAHPALDKAAEVLGIALRRLPVDTVTLALAPEAVARALDRYTCLVYASAPGFAHGVVDDVPGIGAKAAAYVASPWGSRGVPLHVDNCLGGVVLSYMPGAPAFDFSSSPSVSSLSMDLHKFGGAPKGASVLLFRSPALRRHAYTTVTHFPAGLYATPTLAGSRGAGPAALAWATMCARGSDGYAAAARSLAALYARLVAAINAVPGLRVLGTPAACVIAFAPHAGARFSHHALAARMAARGGWALPVLQAPSGLHLAVTERLLATRASDGVVAADAWLADLRVCAAEAAAAPTDPRFEGRGDASIYGATAVLPEGEIAGLLQRYCDILTLVR